MDAMELRKNFREKIKHDSAKKAEGTEKRPEKYPKRCAETDKESCTGSREQALLRVRSALRQDLRQAFL
jgi:hypothetical protein